MSTHDRTPGDDGTYEACLAYLNAKGYLLWGDYSLNPNRNDDGTPKNHAAARWLEAQVRGVADYYDTPARTYAAGRSTKSGRPSARIAGVTSSGLPVAWFDLVHVLVGGHGASMGYGVVAGSVLD